jgi:predicted nucleic acid-binding protein
MIFVYHFLYSPTVFLSRKSARFFKDIEKGKYIGIVTTFTIAEYIAVTKGFLCKKRSKKVTFSEIRTVKARLEQFINKMGIVLYDSDTLATKHAVFADCEDMIERDEPSLGSHDGKWHYLNGADALHLAFANSVNAEAIATFDDDFRGISGSVYPLMIPEVYRS